jgi:hypothetical protein
MWPVAVAALIAAVPGVARVAAKPTARSHAIVPAAATEVAVRVAAAVGLPDGEVGGPAFLLLAFDARQLGANQLAVHGTFFDIRPALGVDVGIVLMSGQHRGSLGIVR